MKTVGIIGGLGPESSSDFYLKLINQTLQINQNEQRPEVLFLSVPLHLKAEEKFIKNLGGTQEFKRVLVDAAQKLEKAGADFIAIPCNSVHLFWEDVDQAVDIPVLNIIKETCQQVANQGLKKIGLLATPVTVDSNLYHFYLKKKGVELVIPAESEQKDLGTFIKELAQGIVSEASKANFLSILSRWQQIDIDAIVLGCTDVQIFLTSKKTPVPLIDSMDVLVDSSVNHIYGNAR